MTEQPVIVVGGARVFRGDCREVLGHLPDNSVDSVVTDPPYELGFMGKKWDSSGIAYDVTVWEECLRVLKPGGHILAFGGSRTFHRLAVAVEDAGFEIRDSIAWIYGSGFPKSLDVSKAIDKRGGENRARQLRFVEWMRSTGLKASEINEAIGKSDVGSHYLRYDQPAIATADLFDKLRPHLPPVPEEIERLVAERTGIEWTDYVKREVVGSREVPVGHAFAGPLYGGDSSSHEVNKTASFSPEAKQWQGWGTALKPAHEPVVVGRKPFGKGSTVAGNVLLWGVGGLNIDGSRIGTEILPGQTRGISKIGTFEGADGNLTPERQGRWPANVILDEVTAGLLDEQSGNVKSTGNYTKSLSKEDFSWQPFSGITGQANYTRSREQISKYAGEQGGASRFFYQAKASKRDRNEGLEELEGQSAGAKGNGLARVCENCGASILKPCDCPERSFVNPAVKNFHPTVKPTALMRYLIKLVTPPGGTVLDPFTGSGSTGKAALLDGFGFVGVELTEEYLPIIEGRLRWAIEQEGETDERLF